MRADENRFEWDWKGLFTGAKRPLARESEALP